MMSERDRYSRESNFVFIFPSTLPIATNVKKVNVKSFPGWEVVSKERVQRVKTNRSVGCTK
jgi:hypothetical protein